MDNIERLLRNAAGHAAGFGACPNCNDNWQWKEQGSLNYSETEGMLICRECLDSPAPLYEEVIRIRLLTLYNWDADKVEAAINAVRKHNNAKSR